MTDVEMGQYIFETFKGVDEVVNEDNHFYFYNPDPNVPADHMFPFVTLMTNDVNDTFSNLNRPGIWRLNIGVSKQTFRALFGLPQRASKVEDAETAEEDEDVKGSDFTALDTIMPHPVYGRMYWVCVVNPSPETLAEKVRPLMDEAYNAAVSKYDKKAAKQ